MEQRVFSVKERHQSTTVYFCEASMPLSFISTHCINRNFEREEKWISKSKSVAS